MPNAHRATALLIACLAACAPRTEPHAWTMVWHDEFDGPAGAAFDRTKWTADTGGGGWGNRERQFYATRPENVATDGAGHLVVTARAESPDAGYRCWYGPCAYSSARLKTQGRFEQRYGRFEARMKIPRGQGIWPAFWMLGSDIETVGWPRSGEIDIMENIGREPRVVHGTIHGPGYSGANSIGGPDTIAAPLADDFHVYAVEWGPDEIRWLLDGRPFRRTKVADLPAGARWVFDHPFFLLLNVAVGGAWPGDPDPTSTFPQTMLVDYVRVYSR